ncbi:hypothetical protein CFU_2952 [Collimonas fungivorans Ter331]|uniref:Uncharacterized protein n=1 Tax=Collimonas fungivorans (strain Ter331) TaxID=1005048 RepID=G0ACI3_COLFT|nr:hypothetical protein CFU_2952 [Collimonas fungivorans Ter331]
MEIRAQRPACCTRRSINRLSTRARLPVAIQRHRTDDHDALDDVLPDVGHAQQHQAVGQHRDDQRADQGAADGADAAGKAGAAQDHRRNRIQFVRLPQLQAVGRGQARRRHHCAQAGQQARYRVDEQQHLPHLDARQARRLMITADCVDLHADHRATQDEPGNRHHQQGDDHQPGHAQHRIVADEGERQFGVEHGLVIRQQARQATHRGQRAERDDKRRQAHEGNQDAVGQPQQQAEADAGGDPQHAELRRQRRQHRHHCRRRQDRADRKVDAGGQDDEGHAGRQHDIHRRLLGDDRQILHREEVFAHQGETQHQQQQHRQHADRAQQTAQLLALADGLGRDLATCFHDICLLAVLIHDYRLTCSNRLPIKQPAAGPAARRSPVR